MNLNTHQVIWKLYASLYIKDLVHPAIPTYVVNFTVPKPPKYWIPSEGYHGLCNTGVVPTCTVPLLGGFSGRRVFPNLALTTVIIYHAWCPPDTQNWDSVFHKTFFLDFMGKVVGSFYSRSLVWHDNSSSSLMKSLGNTILKVPYCFATSKGKKEMFLFLRRMWNT